MTQSDEFPTKEALQPRRLSLSTSNDIFVTKFNPACTDIVYSTYYGGMDTDNVYDICLDDSGSLYMTGITRSDNFPTLNPFQEFYRGGFTEGFVAGLDSTGKNILFSSFLGGLRQDWTRTIAVSKRGNIYVGGYTISEDFNTLNAFQPSLAGDKDVILTKLNPAGTEITYSTFFGGTGEDQVYDVRVDDDDSPFLVGYTLGNDFPTLDALQPSLNANHDCFLTRFLPSGTHLAYSTYFGGSDQDQAFGAAFNNENNLFVMGMTRSIDFPTLNAFQPESGKMADVFVISFVSPFTIDSSSILTILILLAGISITIIIWRLGVGP